MASIGIRKEGATGKKGSGKFGRIGAVVFGLIFLGAGLAMGYFLALPDFLEWSAASEYEAVPATILNVELQRHHGKSTTYNVRASYRYTFRGRQYFGNRVAISDAADNIGDYQQNLYRRLKASKQGGRDVTAWVDPSDPQRALLDREMRWELFVLKSLFAALFVLIGGAVAIFALRAPSAATVAQAIAPQPSGRIVANTRASMWFWWVFAVLWMAISSPGLFFLPKELAKGNWPALLILLFPAVGIWLLTMAVRSTLQWRRFGPLALTLAPYPGAIGGAIRGTVQLPERFRNAQVFRVTITCIRRHTSGSGRNRSTSDTALWQDETRAQADASGRGTQLSFGFTVPANLPPSGTPSNDYVFWAIDVDADLPGVDLDTRFDVPMEPCAPGSSSAMNIPAAAEPSAVPDVPARIVRIFQERDAKVFYYPLFRYPAMSIGLLVFGAIFFAPVVFMFKQLHGGVMDAMLWFMMAVFGLIGVLMFLGGLVSLGNTLRVEISSRGLTTVRRVYGFGFSRYAPLEAIKSVETKIGSQSNSGGKINVRYQVIAHIADGRKITVGTDIPGRPLADHLAKRISAACGVRS
jgi:hypothetical protein